MHRKGDDTTKTNKDMTTAKAARALANSFIHAYVLKLQPQLSPNWHQHVQLLSHAYNNIQQIKRLEDDKSYFHWSTHVEFKLHIRIKVKKSAAFTTLQMETEFQL